MISIIANNIKVYLQVGMNPKRGKNIGVAAHVIVSMFIDMVLNLIA
jgi:hypothetical protein